jgi:hypothetical protein
MVAHKLYNWHTGDGPAGQSLSIHFPAGEIVCLCDECADKYLQSDVWEIADYQQTCEMCGR